MSDPFYRVPRLRRLLQPRDTDLKGVQSPEELVNLQRRRPSQKVVDAKKVLALVNTPTDPGFEYRHDQTHFFRLTRGIEIVSGHGAELIDAEATVTAVG